MYFSMLLSFDRSWFRQRTKWTESSRDGGVNPWAGFAGAIRHKLLAQLVAGTRAARTLGCDLELLDAIRPVRGQNYSHGEIWVSLRWIWIKRGKKGREEGVEVQGGGGGSRSPRSLYPARRIACHDERSGGLRGCGGYSPMRCV